MNKIYIKRNMPDSAAAEGGMDLTMSERLTLEF